MFPKCTLIKINGKFAQTLAAVTVNLFIIADGMHYGWSSPIIPKLKSADPQIPLDKTSITILETMYLIGGLAGLPATMYLTDILGRKIAILSASVLNLLSWILIACTTNIYVLYIARFLAGMTADMGFVSIPMYTAEISDKNIRGALTGFVLVATILGVIIMYSAGPFLTISESALIGAGLNVMSIGTFSFLPESPYYLLKNNDEEKGRKSLKLFRRNSNVEQELDEIRIAVERQRSERGKFIELIANKGNRKAMIIITVLSATLHFGGMSVITMNLNEIFSEAEEFLSPEASSIICSIVMLIGVIIALRLVDKFGRKILLFTSCVLTGLSLTLLATYFVLKDNNYHYNIHWIPLFAVICYSVFLRIGICLVPLVMNAEIFPLNVKSKGMTYGDFIGIISGIICIYIYQELTHRFGIYYPLYIFATCCMLTAFFTVFFIPETKGKTLEEIQMILRGEKLKGSEEIKDVNV
nr:facilitated trehalose transporter Tret1-2 homolog [Onthophagus taurus]